MLDKQESFVYNCCKQSYYNVCSEIICTQHSSHLMVREEQRFHIKHFIGIYVFLKVYSIHHFETIFNERLIKI